METTNSQSTDNEIVLYQSEELPPLEVRVADDTVWLTQAQMAQLFQRDVSVISRHIKNAFAEGELEKESNLHILQIANSDRPTTFFSLDVIISVGYRVKSQRGTRFRIWATKVFKEYLLRGYAIVNQAYKQSKVVLKEYLLRGYAISQRVDRIENQVFALNNQLQSLLHSALPPKQGVFFEGQIFDAYQFVSDLVRSAKTSIILIDNYVNDSVLTLLDKRAALHLRRIF